MPTLPTWLAAMLPTAQDWAKWVGSKIWDSIKGLFSNPSNYIAIGLVAWMSFQYGHSLAAKRTSAALATLETTNKELAQSARTAAADRAIAQGNERIALAELAKLKTRLAAIESLAPAAPVAPEKPAPKKPKTRAATQ